MHCWLKGQPDLTNNASKVSCTYGSIFLNYLKIHSRPFLMFLFLISWNWRLVGILRTGAGVEISWNFTNRSWRLVGIFLTGILLTGAGVEISWNFTNRSWSSVSSIFCTRE